MCCWVIKELERHSMYHSMVMVYALVINLKSVLFRMQTIRWFARNSVVGMRIPFECFKMIGPQKKSESELWWNLHNSYLVGLLRWMTSVEQSNQSFGEQSKSPEIQIQGWLAMQRSISNRKLVKLVAWWIWQIVEQFIFDQVSDIDTFVHAGGEVI